MRIIQRLHVNESVLENRWLSRITKNYRLRPVLKYDWSNIGYVDKKGNRWISYGGIPINTVKQLASQHQLHNKGQLQMDMMLLKILKKYDNEDELD